MSTPSAGAEGAAAQHAAADADAEGTDIPQRLMQVKVLYTFDDQNKSNCLARLPNPLSIPTVSLDETTQVGVIELKACIQAIVSASPELVAKLGHDYTVYAYDFSEYETPLVGQGMLSWILASASTTPNAPAAESQTMVTGRVCKNILGLFSNGIKETLEVKLKLVPVPTCMQSEYVENMERYHSLSKMMPEGMDYKEWAEFLKANPAIGQLAQPTRKNASSMADTMSANAIESFNEMIMNNSLYGPSMSYSTHDTRASSPAMSTTSLYSYQMHPEFRPASQASFHSDYAAHSPYYPPTNEPNLEQREDGPPKKRARVTKAKRPKKTALGTNAESLRVTASTAASVRLHRPVPLNAGASVSAEQVPRAPTPRPRNAKVLPSAPRAPAPSLLRNTSADDGRPYVSPYDSGIFSDHAVESADDDKGDSPSDTPPNLPSSPPLLPENVVSPVPSSPELPMLPPPNDSGFASDMPGARNEVETDQRAKPYEKIHTSIEPEVRMRKKPDRSKRPWSECNPGPVDLLPTAGRLGPVKKQPEPKPLDPVLINHYLSQMDTSQGVEPPAPNIGLTPLETVPFDRPAQDSSIHTSSAADVTTTAPSHSHTRAGTLSLPLSAAKAARGFARSQTWSGEPLSDSAGPDDGRERQPRSGSGAKRKQRDIIRDKLGQAITDGVLPTFCNNCGQIDTPCWRKAYTRVITGTPQDIVVSSKGTAIVAYEIVDPKEGEGEPQYRIFKQALEQEESAEQLFTTLILCNPCGLWLTKKNAMRPQAVWGKKPLIGSADKPKRIRKPKKTKAAGDILTSDAVIPESESGMLDSQLEEEAHNPLDSTSQSQVQPPSRTRSESFRVPEHSKLDEPTARAALMRAYESSPVGVRGASRDTPIDLDGDLTPKPTRRLLFPSPRRPGELRSLADRNMSEPFSPRSSPSKPAKPSMQASDAVIEDGDKENCPPPPGDENDDLQHLFESPRATPTEGSYFNDLMKTPTPGSRKRGPLTPMRHAEINLTSPLRSRTTAPETPFTRQLNDLLSDSMLPRSPSQSFDLSVFPTFNTPGRNNALQFGEFLQSDVLSSDLPIPSSSPPKSFDFSVFEDPNTSTVGLWSGASIFDVGDAIMHDAPFDGQQGSPRNGSREGKILTVNGINLDFTAMIEEVVGETSPEEPEATPDAPTKTRLIANAEADSHTRQATSDASASAEPTASAEWAGATQQKAMPEVPTEVGLVSSVKPASSTQQQATTPNNYNEEPRPRCRRCKQQKKGCDKQHPCGRCTRARVGVEECIYDTDTATSPAFSVSIEPTMQTPQQTNIGKASSPPEVANEGARSKHEATASKSAETTIVAEESKTRAQTC